MLPAFSSRRFLPSFILFHQDLLFFSSPLSSLRLVKMYFYFGKMCGYGSVDEEGDDPFPGFLWFGLLIQRLLAAVLLPLSAGQR